VTRALRVAAGLSMCAAAGAGAGLVLAGVAGVIAGRAADQTAELVTGAVRRHAASMRQLALELGPGLERGRGCW
jgi:hypothetical protein